MFAKVIIDISHHEVNQLFDYIIPSSMEDFLERGSRVYVPFGHQKRLGFVMDIIENSHDATKEIISCVDVVPTLDDEHFMMIESLKHNGPQLYHELLKTVIPNELTVSYQKEVYALDFDRIDDDLKPFFNQKHKWILRKKDQIYQSKLTRLKRQQAIDIHTIIKEKANKKLETIYKYNINHSYSKMNAYPEIIDLFRREPTCSRKDMLDKGISFSQINTLLKHGVLIKNQQEIIRNPYKIKDEDRQTLKLTDEQNDAKSTLVESLNHHKTFLLKGITGSGKTEVYIKVIEEVMNRNKQVLFLVPEIMLIAPMFERLKSKFDHVFVFHSGLSKGERYDQYRQIQKHGQAIILGTRSSVFLKLERLGLIIMDEEHDDSYEQLEGVIYHARDICLLRSTYHNIPLVLGSATPSIESMYQTELNHYELLELKKRPHQLSLPDLHFVDMKEELKQKNTSIFSRKLIESINKRLEKKEQIMLLYNRKGYAPFVLCRSCGNVPKCPDCDISLTYYKDKEILKCHYCGFEQPFLKRCDVCHEEKVKEIGIGIEHVEQVLKKQFPSARVLRLDQNVTKTNHSYELIWQTFRSEGADILLGTQMITKGLDFPKVTLVGVLMADLSLRLPSFRAHEKTYMLLAQATGRSGRFYPGEAIIQGYQLNHYAIASVNVSYEAFYKEALYERKLLQYRPFKKTSQILCQGSSFLKTYQSAFLLKKSLEKKGIDVLGPSQARIKRMRNMHRFIITLKYDEIDVQDVFEMILNLKKETDIDIYYYPIIDIV